MLPVLMSALPLLAKIPDAVKAVSDLIGGDTAEKISKGADFVATIRDEITKPDFPPERMQGLMKILADYYIEIERMKHEERGWEWQHEAKLQETAQVMLQQADLYTKRTRPTILRNHFTLVCAHTLILLLFIACRGAGWLQLDKELLEQAYEMYRANLIFFAANFGGYTAVRSIWDKRAKDAPGPIEKLAGTLWGRKLF